MLLFCCISKLGEDDHEIITPAGESKTPTSSRYMLNGGDVTGIDNSGSKYAIHKQIEVNTTPYLERVERAMQEEERARAKLRQYS